MTTNSKNHPTRVEFKHDNKIGCIVPDQVQTIDQQQIIKELGKLSMSEIKSVKAILEEIHISNEPLKMNNHQFLIQFSFI